MIISVDDRKCSLGSSSKPNIPSSEQKFFSYVDAVKGVSNQPNIACAVEADCGWLERSVVGKLHCYQSVGCIQNMFGYIGLEDLQIRSMGGVLYSYHM